MPKQTNKKLRLQNAARYPVLTENCDREKYTHGKKQI